MPDSRLIVALDVPDALAGLALTQKLGDQVGFYKIGLGMLTGGGLALANELKQEHGKHGTQKSATHITHEHLGGAPIPEQEPK